MKRVYVNEKWCPGCHLCEYYCAFANSGKSSMVKALWDHKIAPRIRIESAITSPLRSAAATAPTRYASRAAFQRAVHRGWGRRSTRTSAWLLHLHPVLPLWRAVHFE